MNKDKFNNLEITQQVEYINNQLKNNNSITSVCKELGIGRSTIRDRFKKNKYIYSKAENLYIYNDELNISKEILDDYNRRNTSVIDKGNKPDIIDISDINIKNNLLELADNYEILKEIIELHRRNTSVVKKQIVIDLPQSESKLVTFRINNDILDHFNKFCLEHSAYRKVDLLSQAIKNFIENYD